MKIVLVAIIRNEADLIELFVRHHVEFFDHLCIVDHLSSDATVPILQALREEGLPVEILHARAPELRQAAVTNALLRHAARERGADWVVALDADEFLATVTGDMPREAIERLAPGEVHALPWVNYVPRPEDVEAGGQLFARIGHRRATEPIPHNKLLVPGALAADTRIRFRYGNHHLVRSSWWSASRKIPLTHGADLRVAHFPVRSAEQLTAKAMVGWPARLASAEQKGRRNWHLHALFDEIRRSGIPGPKTVSAHAQAYAVPAEFSEGLPELVWDPVRSNAKPTRFDALAVIDPLDALAGAAEQLAAELGTLRGQQHRRAWLLARVRRMLGGTEKLDDLLQPAPHDDSATPGAAK